MNQALSLAFLTGAFGLGGVLGGVVLTNHFAQRSDQRRIAGEDERRWLADRRHVYAAYLGIVSSMLRSINSMSSFFFPPRDGRLTDRDKVKLAADITAFYDRWDNELQPALGEVQLLAGPRVAELADRASSALMELNTFIDLDRIFPDIVHFEPKARRLLDVTRDAMRAELGLTSPIETPSPMPKDWPWLPDESETAGKPPPSGAGGSGGL